MSRFDSFDDFFRQATGGLTPFPFQRRLAEMPQMPGMIAAPTGAGKTAAVVLSWLWHRQRDATASELNAAPPPMRLIYCLPMRVLVDQVAAEAMLWRERLNMSEPELTIAILRGGHIDEQWEGHPERPALLIGTQDQLLSRALNRGFAMSPFRWPMHYGLLNNDCWWVLDEVQLMGPGLRTAAQLQAMRARFGAFGVTGTTFMSATLRAEWLQTPEHDPAGLTQLGLNDDDHAQPQLSRRRTASKPLAPCPESEAKAVAAWIAEQHTAGQLTLVVVNRVKRAQELSKRLRKLRPETEHVLIHSRFRRHERRAMEERLTAKIPERGRLVVATQTVEAGVDLSAATLITDLAPWPSLVQRFGRCNRRGEHDDARVFWIDIDTTKKGRAAPYEAAQLDKARAQLLAIDNARIADLPSVKQAWPSTAIPRPCDVLALFDTDPDLDENHVDVSRWIRSSGDTDAAVFWRKLTAEEAKRGPDHTTPQPHEAELCAVSTSALRDLARKRGGAWGWDRLEGKWVRAHARGGGEAAGFITAGGQYLLDERSGGYHPQLGWNGTEKHTSEIRDAPELNGTLPPPDAFTSDGLSHQDALVSLAVHLRDTKDRAEALLAPLRRLIDEEAAEQVITAAGWHDVGKAHPCFQEAIEVQADVLLAKAPRFRRYARSGFRHELASALVAVAQGQPDRTSYLIAAHHGKVRVGLRPLQWDAPLDGKLLRGVCADDSIPAVSTPFGDTLPQPRLPLAIAELGTTSEGASWTDRVLRLLHGDGPFRLAFLETLVRVADWRASAAPSEQLDVIVPVSQQDAPVAPMAAVSPSMEAEDDDA